MINGNMPAMPITLNPGEFAADGMNLDGLTKREYFAAMAMQGLCCREGYGSMEDVAHDALAVANALLAELDKERDALAKARGESGRDMIRCVITPSIGMFHEGGVYQTYPTPTGTPNVFQVQDDLGHWRVMLWDELSFIVENGDYNVGAKHAYFEIVEDTP